MLVPISNRDRRLPIRLRSLVGGQRDPRLQLRASRLVQDAVRAWPGPCGVIKAALDDAVKTKHGPIILTSIDQQPWTSDGFRASWRKACRKAGIVGITFNDLRGTAVTRLALAGCTEAEIAAITGHSLRDVRSILDAHYLHRDPALAESAIRKLERGTKAPD